MRFKLIVIGLIISLFYVFLVFLYWEPENRITQKWLITVDTPNGIVTGSSNTILVNSIRKKPFSKFISTKYTGLHGEIPYVQLSDNKFLFALVLYKPNLPKQVYAQQIIKNQGDAFSIEKLMSTSTQVIKLSKDQTPTFFTFDNINDPKTLREVDETHLSQYFGAGYNFKSISLQLTKEDPTVGKIYKSIPWLKGYKDYFNYYYALPTKNHKLMKAMNRLDIERRKSCIITSRTMRILTLGYISQGISCAML